ncbi:MAG: hypothetical protein AMXMBFR53_04120 [Gemmatimonadota bacterium]
MVLAALWAWGCGGEVGSVPAVVTERDSAGIHIVENPAALVEAVLPVSPGPMVSVGTLEGDPAAQLFRVSAAARLSDGTIVVANGGTRDVRFFGSDGAHLRTVGGQGRGPEEYRYPVAVLVMPGDTLIVQDRLDRVWYAADGTFLERVTGDMGALQALTGPDAFPEGGLWLADGTLFVPAYLREEGQPRAGPPFRPGIRLLRASWDLASAEFLGEYGGIQQQFVEVEPGPRGVMPMVSPYAVSTSYVGVASDGTLVVGDSDRPELHVFRADGARERFRWAAEREVLTPAEVEAWKEAQRAAGWIGDRLPQFERGWAAMTMPETKAAFGHIAGGRDGSVWVPVTFDSAAELSSFLVFTAEGRLRGRASVPGPFAVMDAGDDWVLGIWRDANDVEYLRLHRVGP